MWSSIYREKFCPFSVRRDTYFKENLKLFPPLDFIAERTQHIPPLGMQYIRRYGIYSSRGRGPWNQKPYILALAPEGGTQGNGDPSASQKPPQTDLGSAESRSAWARLIAKVYETDPCRRLRLLSRQRSPGSRSPWEAELLRLDAPGFRVIRRRDSSGERRKPSAYSEPSFPSFPGL
jgi:hypothetical protein